MKPCNMLWLQSAGCGGCSISVLNMESPDFYATLKQNNIQLLWHPSLSEESGDDFQQILKRIMSDQLQLDLLCVEGALLMGPQGTGRFHLHSGSRRPMFEIIKEVSTKARFWHIGW